MDLFPFNSRCVSPPYTAFIYSCTSSFRSFPFPLTLSSLEECKDCVQRLVTRRINCRPEEGWGGQGSGAAHLEGVGGDGGKLPRSAAEAPRRTFPQGRWPGGFPDASGCWLVKLLSLLSSSPSILTPHHLTHSCSSPRGCWPEGFKGFPEVFKVLVVPPPLLTSNLSL